MSKPTTPKLCFSCKQPIDTKTIYYTITLLRQKFDLCKKCGIKKPEVIENVIKTFLFDVADILPQTVTHKPNPSLPTT